MTKPELIAQVATEAKITKVTVAQAIDCVTDTITTEVKKGERISLTGFGTLSVANREARTGRNPRIGQDLRIPATKPAKFTRAKVLRGVVK